jgi:hypothetical protein
MLQKGHGILILLPGVLLTHGMAGAWWFRSTCTGTRLAEARALRAVGIGAWVSAGLSAGVRALTRVGSKLTATAAIWLVNHKTVKEATYVII